MDSVEISLQTTLGFDVKFDIEAIEHYNGLHTANNYPTGASNLLISDDNGKDIEVLIF